MTTGFKPSKTTLHRLTPPGDSVNPILTAMVLLAMMKYSTRDFGVGADPVRTREKQKYFYDMGVSQTMDSKHLIQVDGYSWAVDLYPSGYPTVDDIPTEAYRDVADAMDLAAADFGMTVEHGVDFGMTVEHGVDWGWDGPHHQSEF